MASSNLKGLSFCALVLFLAAQGTTNPDEQTKIQPRHMRFDDRALTGALDQASEFGQIPLYFIRNEGQVDQEALFYANAPGYTLWLTRQGLVFDSVRPMENEDVYSEGMILGDMGMPDTSSFERDVSSLQFLNSSPFPEAVPTDMADYTVNYFIGNDESKWRTNIQTSKGVLYKDIYPHIDLEIYGIEKKIEYDFIIKPGGDVSDICYEFRDVEGTNIDAEGSLVITSQFGEFKHCAPHCYQFIGGKKIQVDARFRKVVHNTFAYETAEYDKYYDLIIDPLVLVYSKYLGGGRINDIAVDSAGAAYVTGYAYSTEFPVKNPIQKKLKRRDAFVSKIDPSGKELVYSTYLGGSYDEYGNGIVVDSEGAAYITGGSSSSDFPTRNPVQEFQGGRDAYVTKIDPSGSILVYSTYIGGLFSDSASDVTLDSFGAAYLTGQTSSPDFPKIRQIKGCFGGVYDAFITKIDPSGTTLVHSTRLGSPRGPEYEGGTSVAVDSTGAAYVTGYTESPFFPLKNPIRGRPEAWYGWYMRAEAFVSKIDPSGASLVYSTFLGGSERDLGYSIAVDSVGAAYVTGSTRSDDFPTQNPIQENLAGLSDMFLSKINPSGTAFEFSTYLGGWASDSGIDIAVDAIGAAYVTGATASSSFPIKNSIQEFSGQRNIFVVKFRSSGNRVYSTLMGGPGRDLSRGIAVDSSGAAYVIGSKGYFSPYYGQDFITKICSPHDLSITSGKGGTTNPSPGTHSYDCGSKVDIEALPSPQYRFFGWSGDISTVDNPLTITMDSDKSVTANFIRQYQLTLASGAGGTTTPQPGAYVHDAGSELTLTALPDTHFKFSHWSGGVSGSENPIKITMDSDLAITANFLRIIYAPLNFSGQKVFNRSLSQADYLNILSWQANPNNITIVKYRIYEIAGEARTLLVELNTGTFQYQFRGVDGDKRYSYGICAVNSEGREGILAYITVQ